MTDRPLDDTEALVGRTIAGITSISRRIVGYTTLLLVTVGLIVVVSFLLGLAALDGGIRTVWILLGLGFGGVAIWCAFVARWRVGAILKHIPKIANEVRAMIVGGNRETIEVIDRFQEQHGPPGSQPVMYVSSNVSGLRGLGGVSGSIWLAKAVRAVTTFPLLALTAIAISVVFAVMVPIFLLALAL